MTLNTTNLSYLGIISSVGFFIVPIWELIKNRDEKGKVRITTIGWICLILAIYSGFISALTIHANTKEQKNASHKADSTRIADKKDLKNDVDTALKKYGLKLSKDSKTIIKIDSINSFVNPQMDVIQQENKKNPYFDRNKSTTADSVQFNLIVGSINKGIAYNIRDTVTFFALLNGKFLLLSKTSRLSNESLKSYGNNDLRAFVGLHFGLPSPVIDTEYIFYKAIYSNKPINGQDQYPLRKIFYLIIPVNTTTIKGLDDLKEVENEDIYAYLKTQLIKNRLW